MAMSHGTDSQTKRVSGMERTVLMSDAVVALNLNAAGAGTPAAPTGRGPRRRNLCFLLLVRAAPFSSGVLGKHGSLRLA